MKSIKLFTLPLLALLICSCGNTGISLTSSEDKGIKSILDEYGGQCKYSVGVSASTSEGKKKYFKIELSQSEGLKEFLNTPEMPASNIAYLFFEKLNTEERVNYDEIRVELINSKDEKLNFSYPTELLNLVNQKMRVAYKVTDLLKNKDFEQLLAMMKDSSAVFVYNKHEVVEKVKEAEREFGNITEGFRPLGFYAKPLNENDRVLHIAGVIVRDKKTNAFSIDLDPMEKDDIFYLMQYKW